MNATISAALPTAIATLFLSLAASSAHAADPVQHLWFADSQTSAFYAIDEVNHQLILLTEAGPQGRQAPVRTVRPLAQGERVSLSLDGTGLNALTATLNVERQARGTAVHVDTIVHSGVVARLD
ncbi:MAG: hypothetical protein R3E94_03640 [Burkholderiaceae bacterium]